MPKGVYPRLLFEERFWLHVIKSDGCWVWKGALTKDGYGCIERNTRLLRTHRVSWELTNGTIPEGLLVMHHCDNRPCVNPDHLFIGTVGDNNRDCLRKGRHRYILPNLKLNIQQVMQIREALTRGESQKVLASHYGVTAGHIHRIKTGKKWGSC